MTKDRLYLPQPALSPYLFAAILRDTRGRALRHNERFNHFPASPLCAVTWTFEGQTHLLSATKSTPLPRLSFCGPQNAPTMSWNPGEVVAMTLGFYPDAWQALTGQSMEPLLDKALPLEAVVSADMLKIFAAVQGPEGFEELQNKLRPHWPRRAPVARALGAWARSLAVRSTTAGLGRSVRQAQRRLGMWTGQNARSLARYARIEALEAQVHRGAGLAELAQSAGFSDQSHMGRDLKRVTGNSPARLRARIAQDEAFWAYRLLGSQA